MPKRSVTLDIKNQVIGLHLANKSSREIAILLNISQSCATKTIKKFKETGSVNDEHRSGRPRKTSLRDDRLIFRLARSNPTYSLAVLARNINPSLEKSISRKTISRRLAEKKLFSYVAPRKPLLKPTDRIRRMNFCRQMLRMTQAELNSIVFSDEANFEVHNRKNTVLVRRFSHEKYDDRFVTPHVQGGGGSVGIWGCIGFKGIGSVKINDGRMNQYVYRDILDECLIPTIHNFFGDSSSFYFQHDNAPCHTAHSIRTYLEQSNIRVLEWPARSPDLNIIENLWSVIDRKLTENPVTTPRQLKSRIEEIYKETSADYCQKLFKSIHKRCLMVIANKGGHIPY